MLPQLVPHSVPIAAAVIVGAFFILTYSANFLVDGAVGVAFKLRISKIVIGIVLVGFATTSPELAVSLLAAINGKPEIALGNAVGSVIVDDALALALGIIVAPVALKVDSRVLRTTGLFLIAVAVASFLLAGPIAVPGGLNGCSGGATACVGRIEGFALIATYFVYIDFVVRHERRKRRATDSAAAVADGAGGGGGAAPAADESNELADHVRPGGVAVQLGWLGVGECPWRTLVRWATRGVGGRMQAPGGVVRGRLRAPGPRLPAARSALATTPSALLRLQDGLLPSVRGHAG